MMRRMYRTCMGGNYLTIHRLEPGETVDGWDTFHDGICLNDSVSGVLDELEPLIWGDIDTSVRFVIHVPSNVPESLISGLIRLAELNENCFDLPRDYLTIEWIV